MPERIVSAGVFTKEIDQSFLPAAIGQIGAAIVGPTVKGPALVPTKVSSYADYVEKFGGYTDESYVPYAVNEYLRNGNSLTVTRLLYEDGYALKNGAIAIIAESASTKTVSHVLHPTTAVSHVSNTTNVFESSVLTGGVTGSISLKISGTYTTDSDVLNGNTFLAGQSDTISSSVDSSSNKYITKIFGKSPKSIDYPVYVMYENESLLSTFGAAANISHITTSASLIANLDYSGQDYSNATTPWITSQKIGTTVKDLFRFHTISHGTSVNHEVKVGIRDIRTSAESADPDGYGSFTVEIRRVNTTNIPNSPYISTDTDNSPDIVETFGNVNLNPDSANYIANRIGDRYQTINDAGQLLISGDFVNKSKYVRVEVKSAVKEKANEKSLVPFGFRSLYSPIPAVSTSIHFAPASYLTTQVNGVYSPSNYLGFNYSNATNLNYLCPLVNDSSKTTGSNADFYLGDITQDSQAGFPTPSTAFSGSLETALINSEFKTKVALSTRKFMVPFQGGFDGARPNLPKFSGEKIKDSNTFGFNCSSDTATGTKAYNKAFTLLSNTDYYDINMLITPGIFDKLHNSVTTLARNLCIYRQDTFYVMDTHALKTNGITTTISDIVNDVSALDNNYTAAYWPWVRILNPTKRIPIWVPPSVVVPGALTFNDSVAAPWYAPAGLNRGGLPSVIEAYIPLSQAQRNSLYEARINPIATFPNDGVVVWGQKTLQARPSALDRVNVRRLLIAVKKFIASATRYLVFEQNTLVTQNKFLNIVNPYLESVKVAQGLYAFKAVMDSTNNTPDLIDQNILYGQIFLQPTKTAEFIILDFNIQPTGAAFPE